MTMGDAADDAFDQAIQDDEIDILMKHAMCYRCPMTHNENKCPVCHDLGWLDHNGNPCEP